MVLCVYLHVWFDLSCIFLSHCVIQPGTLVPSSLCLIWYTALSQCLTVSVWVCVQRRGSTFLGVSHAENSLEPKGHLNSNQSTAEKQRKWNKLFVASKFNTIKSAISAIKRPQLIFSLYPVLFLPHLVFSIYRSSFHLSSSSIILLTIIYPGSSSIIAKK